MVQDSPKEPTVYNHRSYVLQEELSFRFILHLVHIGKRDLDHGSQERDISQQMRCLFVSPHATRK